MDMAVWVVFTVGSEALALRRDDVRRILPLPALGRPPGLPQTIEGFLNLAGAEIPVLRLDRLFGFPTPSLHPYQHLLLLNGARPSIALLVDRVTEVLRVIPSSVRQLPPGETFNDCVVGALSHGGRPIHILSVERLLLEQERQALADFQQMQERRCEEIGSPA